MIAVFDTNVLIAAIITEGVCSKLLLRARAGEFSLVSCPFIMREARRVLSKKFRLHPEEIESAVEPILEAVHHLIEGAVPSEAVCRDKDDDNVLACAVAAKAGYLVTGDADLLEIGSFRGVKILAPRDFELMFF